MSSRASRADPVGPGPTGRRRFLRGAAALGLEAAAAAALGRAAPALAEAGAKPGLVDVHHHHVPPFYVAENRERIRAAFGGMMRSPWTSWTAEAALEAMDRNGVQTAVLSLTSPGVWFGEPQESRKLARRVNDYAAELRRSHPGRFGLFAAVPLPDPEGSLREIEYALDALKADGIGLLTSYGDRWLGDPLYAPVLEELQRRKAVVFVHPSVPLCCRTLLPDVPPVIEEIPQDTARAIGNLLYTGTFARFRDVRFIFAHAGGTMPMIAGRMAAFPPARLAEVAPQGIEHELRRQYYDIAATAHRPAIAALRSLVPSSQILFGSDHPYVPLDETAHGMRRVGFSERELRLVGRDNALALLPRLRVA